MEWFGCADVDFHTAAKPIKISEKDGSPRSLLDICEETVPPCNLNPLLFNGHLQTCWTAANKTAPPVHYKRRIFEAEHSGYSGSFTVDFFTPDAAADDEVDPSLPERTTYFSEEEIAGGLGSDDARPMLVILHGLSGGSHEVYLRHGIAPLLDSGAWEACVINSRGCAMSKITTGILYNARATWDTRQLVRHLRKTFPNRPLFGLGFSLGACILTNVRNLLPFRSLPYYYILWVLMTSYSIWARRVPIVSSRLPSHVPTPGTWNFRAKHSSGRS